MSPSLRFRPVDPATAAHRPTEHLSPSSPPSSSACSPRSSRFMGVTVSMLQEMRAGGLSPRPPASLSLRNSRTYEPLLRPSRLPLLVSEEGPGVAASDTQQSQPPPPPQQPSLPVVSEEEPEQLPLPPPPPTLASFEAPSHTSSSRGSLPSRCNSVARLTPSQAAAAVAAANKALAHLSPRTLALGEQPWWHGRPSSSLARVPAPCARKMNAEVLAALRRGRYLKLLTDVQLRAFAALGEWRSVGKYQRRSCSPVIRSRGRSREVRGRAWGRGRGRVRAHGRGLVGAGACKKKVDPKISTWRHFPNNT
ncbi:hypothetical protein T492DRAFT_923140, partial [Pavlovales sp. CCMP2436]